MMAVVQLLSHAYPSSYAKGDPPPPVQPKWPMPWRCSIGLSATRAAAGPPIGSNLANRGAPDSRSFGKLSHKLYPRLPRLPRLPTVRACGDPSGLVFLVFRAKPTLRSIHFVLLLLPSSTSALLRINLSHPSHPSPPSDLCLITMAQKTAGGNAAFHNFHNDYAHIADPNERRRLALAEIDKAPFGWYHVRAIIVAGIGFFTDAYDIFAIGLVTTMLGVVYWHDAKTKPGSIPATSDTAIKVATSGGTVIGQVGFGALADIVGRKKMYGLELIVIIFATMAQALTSASPSMNIVGLIIFWRVLMGIGIGGDYPLSSIITSE